MAVNQTKIRADFSKPVSVKPSEYRWVPSPVQGVERMMLDRIGDEVARATSLVRYAPNSKFTSHKHDGGEEYFVLDGKFGDEHGEYEAGTYVRNPIGSHHAPKVGKEGAIIFVKLHQFEKEDREHKVINTSTANWHEDERSKISILNLHQYVTEYVSLIKIPQDKSFTSLKGIKGEEIFILKGSLTIEKQHYNRGSWLRFPYAGENSFQALEDTTIFLKTGHLPIE